ncbi:MAG: DUF3426 domain-containing protein [Pseudoxanthomonas sp.]
MFISCPHCRELVALDRETRLAPDMCPRCGGVISKSSNPENTFSEKPLAASTSVLDTLAESPTAQTPAAQAQGNSKPSFASFLQVGELAVIGAADATPIETATEPADSAPTAEPAIPDDPIDAPSIVETSAQTTAQPTPAIDPPLIDDSLDDVVGTHGMPITAEPAPAPQVATATAPIMQALPAMPSFTRQAPQSAPRPPAGKWQWTMLILLSLTLLLQVLLADRARLAADAGWRPLIAPLCDALHCTLPPWHQPGAFSMLSRDVSPIAGSGGGLNVQATFRNDARWAQAWPVLVVSLSDADGRVLGSRAFMPREYLGMTATQTELAPAQLAPGQSAQIALQLHEPDPNVVAFTFDFR